jgi:hypothetical protein
LTHCCGQQSLLLPKRLAQISSTGLVARSYLTHPANILIRQGAHFFRSCLNGSSERKPDLDGGRFFAILHHLVSCFSRIMTALCDELSHLFYVFANLHTFGLVC